ncbi:MAG: hypothetical protein IPM23_06230 [Candidatus Melainabacteria bacterium]|nr:hypothetical protein [Candidatus Melainabacteria bacterium]
MIFKTRNKRGSAITLTTVLAFALVILGLGYLAFLMFMGGQNETKNACDSGALNTGKRAADDVSVILSPAPNQSCFFDLTNDKDHTSNDGKINLRRINRVWAKALLIALNAENMQSEGQGGSSGSSVQSANSGAQAISDSLASKLSDPSNLYGFFSEIAEQNSVRMLGSGAGIKVKPGAGWETSFMERAKESNVTLPGGSDGISLPPGSSLAGNYVTPTTRNPAPSGSNGLTFLKGYTALQKQGQTFWQVPFLFDEKPHLVSRYKFIEDQSNPPWNSAVPNAFSCDSEGMKTGAVGQQAKGWVLSNPRETFRMCMPHSYVHIHVEDMKSLWYYYPVLPPPLGAVQFGSQDYGYVPTTQSGAMPAGGVLCASVMGSGVPIGLDVVGRTLDDIIFGMPAGSTTSLENNLTARANQMVSKVGVLKTSGDVHSALGDPTTIGFLIAGERDFYLLSTNGENLKCYPKMLAVAQAPWLATMINQSGDGSEKKVVDDANGPGIIGFSVTAVPDPFCSPLIQFGWTVYHKDVKWKPGTGYNGNLGDVTVKRWTAVHSYGVCNPL